MPRRLAFAVVVACCSVGAEEARAFEPYVGEVRLLAFNFCPNGWLEANGALLPISENEILFQLYGTTWGGDGETTFALPDLRGRTPIAVGQGPGLSSRQIGEAGGAETATLEQSQLPAHTHVAAATTDPASAVLPTGRLPSARSRTPIYRSGSPADAARAAAAVGTTGGGQPHENMAPFATLRWCVSLFGVFPQPN
jgi:microcystin-dependent protein